MFERIHLPIDRLFFVRVIEKRILNVKLARYVVLELPSLLPKTLNDVFVVAKSLVIQVSAAATSYHRKLLPKR